MKNQESKAGAKASLRQGRVAAFGVRVRMAVLAVFLVAGMSLVALAPRTASALGFTNLWTVYDFSILGCGVDTRNLPFGILSYHIWHQLGLDVLFWDTFLKPDLKKMAYNFMQMGFYHVEAVGGFFDAGESMATIRLLHELQARAHKDYHPSVQICTMGTIMEGVNAAQSHGQHNSYVLARQFIDRQMRAESSGAAGEGQDIKNRLEIFKKNFCDPYDNNGGMVDFCPYGPLADQVNKDIDYGGTIMTPYTVRADFSDAGTEWNDKDDGAVTALARNLYGSDLFDAIPEDYLSNPENQPRVLDMRAVIAKRSVAQNSFAALAGMKSASAPSEEGVFAANQYVAMVFRQLGMGDTSLARSALGMNPSYYALMELITKKIYQDPEFYTNLYDKPANVDRMAAAMQSFSLMQNMDSFRSHLRSEMLLSVALELALDERQSTIQEHLDELSSEIGR